MDCSPALRDLQKPDFDDEDRPLLRVTAGPFAGQAGVLISSTPLGTAQVRLTVAGEEVTVQMPLTDCSRFQ